jgi:hypothetical protein
VGAVEGATEGANVCIVVGAPVVSTVGSAVGAKVTAVGPGVGAAAAVSNRTVVSLAVVVRPSIITASVSLLTNIGWMVVALDIVSESTIVNI